MDVNKDNIAVSALYTAATWHWAGLANADTVTPANAHGVFKLVNAYMVFYRWLNPRSYSLPYQLLHRHSAIDYLLKHSGCQRVIEVACGFSPRAATFSADPACWYVEMDLPAMIAHKQAQLEASAAGRAILARPNLQLRAGDITTHDFAADAGNAPTAIITEGLMMYFNREQQLPIWRSIATALQASDGLYLFDYIPLSEEPPRSWLGRMLHHVRVHWFGIVGDFAYDNRDRDAVAADLRRCGFSHVQCHVTGEVADAWGLPSGKVPTRTLIYACRVLSAVAGERS